MALFRKVREDICKLSSISGPHHEWVATNTPTICRVKDVKFFNIVQALAIFKFLIIGLDGY